MRIEVSIAVVIPIGPHKSDQTWLEECIASVYNQTLLPDELIIIDDMADPGWIQLFNKYNHPNTKLVYYDNPWLLGVAASFNIGISFANSDLMFMLGSDDKLLPTCLEQVVKTYKKHNDLLGYYYVEVVYDNGERQSLACNAAAVTRKLWEHTGGFSPETSVGAPDAAFISTLLAHKGAAGNLYLVDGGVQYFVRRHKNQDTVKRKSYQKEIVSVRNIVTANWKIPKWGRVL